MNVDTGYRRLMGGGFVRATATDRIRARVCGRAPCVLLMSIVLSGLVPTALAMTGTEPREGAERAQAAAIPATTVYWSVAEDGSITLADRPMPGAVRQRVQSVPLPPYQESLERARREREHWQTQEAAFARRQRERDLALEQAQRLRRQRDDPAPMASEGWRIHPVIVRHRPAWSGPLMHPLVPAGLAPSAYPAGVAPSPFPSAGFPSSLAATMFPQPLSARPPDHSVRPR